MFGSRRVAVKSRSAANVVRDVNFLKLRTINKSETSRGFTPGHCRRLSVVTAITTIATIATIATTAPRSAFSRFISIHERRRGPQFVVKSLYRAAMPEPPHWPQNTDA
jgi:hypothetical protein